MVCPKCGARPGPSDLFCEQCGEYLLPTFEDKPEADTDSAAPAAFPDPEPAGKEKKQVIKLYPPEKGKKSVITATGRKEHPDAVKAAEHNKQKAKKEAPAPDFNAGTDGDKDHGPTADGHPPISGENEDSAKEWKRGMIVAIVIAIIVAAAAAGFLVYTWRSSKITRNQLNRAITERDNAYATVSSLEEQIDALEESLSSERDNSSSLNSQVDDLETRLSGMESDVSQSTVDKENAERKLTAVQERIDTLTENEIALKAEIEEKDATIEENQSTISDLEAEKADLEEEKEALQETIDENESTLDFYDSYVVFVMLSDTDKLYHKLDCTRFTRQNFLAYSPKLAEASGYSPCPLCCGTGTDDTTDHNLTAG